MSGLFLLQAGVFGSLIGLLSSVDSIASEISLSRVISSISGVIYFFLISVISIIAIFLFNVSELQSFNVSEFQDLKISHFGGDFQLIPCPILCIINYSVSSCLRV